MSELSTEYALEQISPFGFAETVANVRRELANEGFGVLCEIDVQATLKEKLGVERAPYLILGACNPPLAHQALDIEPQLGVLLPCNVVVYESDGHVRAAAVDAKRLLGLVDAQALRPIADDVRLRLERVVRRATRL